jgi:hypothetical protein
MLCIPLQHHYGASKGSWHPPWVEDVQKKQVECTKTIRRQ